MKDAEGLRRALAEAVRQLDGLFVGQLTDDQLALFNEACAVKVARRIYEGGAGLLGLAKVQVLR